MKIFIGSSSEQLPVAKEIRRELEFQFNYNNWKLPEDLVITVWADFFGNGEYNGWHNWKIVEAAIDECDLAIMLFAQDDNVHKRGRDVKMPRDNVILEAGAFAQRYGIENVILLVPKDETYLPTDFLGLQTIVFDYMRGADNKDAYRIMKEKISSYMANTIERDNIKTDNVKLKFSEDTDKGISIKGGRIK